MARGMESEEELRRQRDELEARVRGLEAQLNAERRERERRVADEPLSVAVPVAARPQELVAVVREHWPALAVLPRQPDHALREAALRRWTATRFGGDLCEHSCFLAAFAALIEAWEGERE